MPSRMDIGELRSPVRMANGFMLADAYLTRSGIFEYRDEHGNVRREFRPPDEVFSADTMATALVAPVTEEHPPAMLTAETARQYLVGAVAGTAAQRGDYLYAPLMLFHGPTISGLPEKHEISCGYHCELENAPGEWNGERYDSVQRKIRINHVAITTAGRAGHSVALRYDTIKQEGGEWVVYSADGTKVLGRFKKRQQAVERLQQVENFKARDRRDREALMKITRRQLVALLERRDSVPGPIVKLLAQARNDADTIAVPIDMLKSLLSNSDPSEVVEFLWGLLGATSEPTPTSEPAEPMMEAATLDSAPRADSSVATLKAEVAALRDQMAAEKMDRPKAIAGRLDLERRATAVIPHFDGAGLSDEQVRKAITDAQRAELVRYYPTDKEKLERADSAYLQARYDVAREQFRGTNLSDLTGLQSREDADLEALRQKYYERKRSHLITKQPSNGTAR